MAQGNVRMLTVRAPDGRTLARTTARLCIRDDTMQAEAT